MNLEGLTERVTSGRWQTVYYEDNNGEILYKVCGSCGTLKSLNDYAKNKSSLGGRESACKVCRAITRRERHERDREKEMEISRKWYQANKERHIESVRSWKINNPERSASIKKDWTRNNQDRRALSEQRRRARKNSLPDNFTDEQMNGTLKYFQGCALTGDNTSVQWDHVIAISTGHGGTTLGNMIPLRGDLNSSKCDTNIFEWFNANQRRFNLEQWRFDKLIEWLSKANAMSVEEYRAYVYECHANHNVIDADEAI
jgi:hypothetical protein